VEKKEEGGKNRRMKEERKEGTHEGRKEGGKEVNKEGRKGETYFRVGKKIDS
jgi:hypothetical protein